MHLAGAFKTFPGGDNDLSSVAPAILPNNMLFQIGKQQTGFLVDTPTMTKIHSLTCAAGQNAFGADALDGSHLFVPCLHGIQEVNVNVSNRTMSLGWTGPNVGAADSPILADGSLWTIDRASSTLYVLNPANGAVRTDDRPGPGRALRRARGRARSRARAHARGHHRIRRALRECRRTRPAPA